MQRRAFVMHSTIHSLGGDCASLIHNQPYIMDGTLKSLVAPKTSRCLSLGIGSLSEACRPLLEQYPWQTVENMAKLVSCRLLIML